MEYKMNQKLDFWRVTLRKFKWNDLYAVQALINVIAEDEAVPFFYNMEWLHYVLNQPIVDAETNCFVATVYGGKVVGYSRLQATEHSSRKTVIAGTHPKMRDNGIGRSLVTLSDFNMMAISGITVLIGVMAVVMLSFEGTSDNDKDHRIRYTQVRQVTTNSIETVNLQGETEVWSRHA